MKGMFESLRCELRHRGSNVHVTVVQLPGMNTPQFDHCLSKMPRHPMPVPPIYQPEVAARAIYWAAHHRRRELYVGLPTVYTILGNKLAPWLAEATRTSSSTEPRTPSIMRRIWRSSVPNALSHTRKKSSNFASPEGPTSLVSSTSVSSRYERTYSHGPSAVGLIEQCPPPCRSRMRPKALPESNLGRQHHSIDASREISAALWQSPISP